MKTTIYKAPVCELKALNNLFIEMTAKNCNQRCSHCYIDFPLSKKIKDFISQDTIKKALNDTMNEPLECIYLTGAEPMTHPDFNSILRLCLKRANTCICTNGSFINEKKARFLKRVEDESNYEIIFKLSIDHYDELKNDNIRGRGAYRQVIHAIKNLIKYDFNPILSITNYYNEDKLSLINGVKSVLDKTGFQIEDRNITINKWHNKNKHLEDSLPSENYISLDCEYGRILTEKGIYSCPFLSNDHRGRSGADFKDYSHKSILETPYCNTCLENKRQVFGINFSDFNI